MRQYNSRLLIDSTHQMQLSHLLLKVLLIDTYGIYPEHAACLRIVDLEALL